MANSEYVGLVTCPLCGNDSATVHQQKTGTKKGRLYYRCYETINGAAMCCGTIQCIGPSGQAFIKKAMRPIGQEAEPPVKPVDTLAPERESVEPEPIAQPEPKRRGLLENFLTSLGDD